MHEDRGYDGAMDSTLDEAKSQRPSILFIILACVCASMEGTWYLLGLRLEEWANGMVGVL